MNRSCDLTMGGGMLIGNLGLVDRTPFFLGLGCLGVNPRTWNNILRCWRI